MVDSLCPLCTPDLLERPRFQWQRYRNCSAHGADLERYTQFMTTTPETSSETSPKERGQQAVAERQPVVRKSRTTEATPAQASIIQRFENAAQFLVEHRVNLTGAQEKKFLEKLAELVDIYEAEYPGEIPPLACYDKDSCLAIRWPEGFHKRSMDARRAARAREAGLSQ